MPTMLPENASRLLERVAELYARTYDDVPGGRVYLERHGITDRELPGRHRVGYADGRLIDLLPKDGLVKGELRRLGVLLESGTERFAGCVVFPVHDVEGALSTLCGIAVGSDSGRCLYLPGRPTGIWNAAAIKMYPEIILAGSVMDALSVMMAGHGNVMAGPCSGIGDAEVVLLKTHGVASVKLLLSGERGAERAASGLLSRFESHGVAASVMKLPEGQAPNRFLREQGAAKMAEFIALAGSSTNGIKTSPRAEPGTAFLSTRVGVTARFPIMLFPEMSSWRFS